MWPAPGVERIHKFHRGVVKANLLRLSEHDRRMRFCAASTDEAIGRYVDGIDFDTSRCFGAFDGTGALIALAEPSPFRAANIRRLEAAFTTDGEWRGLGLAKASFEAMKAWADIAGIERIVLHCDARNTAMRALLRSIDAATSVDHFEVDATVRMRTISPTQAARAIG